jgi:hypothetical protein
MSDFRPKSIIWFERLFLASLLISFVQLAVTWRAIAGFAPPLLVLIVAVVLFGLYLVLTFLVSRKGIAFAKWLLIFLFILGLRPAIDMIQTGRLTGWEIVSVVTTAIQAIALGFLFTASARAWLGRKGSPPADGKLRETFD